MVKGRDVIVEKIRSGRERERREWRETEMKKRRTGKVGLWRGYKKRREVKKSNREEVKTRKGLNKGKRRAGGEEWGREAA